MTLEPHHDPAVIERGESVLRALREWSNSLVYASIVTEDGFQIAEIAASANHGSRFASMASSIQSLSEAVARELTIGGSEYVVIAAKEGHVIQLRVPGQQFVLAALFDNFENLGMALSNARRAASNMAGHLAPAH